VPAAEVTLLHRRLHEAPSGTVQDALGALVADLRRRVHDGGWTDAELRMGVARRLGDDHVPALERRDRAGHLSERLSRGVAVCVLLTELPLQAEGHSRSSRSDRVDPEVSRRLATVRALLAKAERTEFEAEAEALSAKAQAMVTKFALDRLLRDHDAGTHGADLEVARLWLDPPYVMPKAMIVGAVARANRCRTAVSEVIGLCTVLGHPDDLDYVELLATSLLVQASRAMLQHGSQTDRSGGSRTRSFRQSFLVSFATRIGERLLTATAAEQSRSQDEPHTQAGASVALVVRDHEERVAHEFAQRFPTREKTGPSVTDPQGWHAGRVAADLAGLDVHPPVSGA
jgi:hypothetical protein